MGVTAVTVYRFGPKIVFPSRLWFSCPSRPDEDNQQHRSQTDHVPSPNLKASVPVTSSRASDPASLFAADRLRSAIPRDLVRAVARGARLVVSRQTRRLGATYEDRITLETQPQPDGSSLLNVHLLPNAKDPKVGARHTYRLDFSSSQPSTGWSGRNGPRFMARGRFSPSNRSMPRQNEGAHPGFGWV